MATNRNARCHTFRFITCIADDILRCGGRRFGSRRYREVAGVQGMHGEERHTDASQPPPAHLLRPVRSTYSRQHTGHTTVFGFYLPSALSLSISFIFSSIVGRHLSLGRRDADFDMIGRFSISRRADSFATTRRIIHFAEVPLRGENTQQLAAVTTATVLRASGTMLFVGCFRAML